MALEIYLTGGDMERFRKNMKYYEGDKVASVLDVIASKISSVYFKDDKEGLADFTNAISSIMTILGQKFSKETQDKIEVIEKKNMIAIRFPIE